MTAQEALNKALWSKLSSELRKSIIRSVDEEKLTVSYKNPNPEDTKILNKLGYHVMSNHDGLTYISWDLENSTDKIEPRFKVGDWIVFIKSKSIYQVEKKENYKYTLRHILGGSFCLSFSNEDLIREWTIQDAMDGDILVHNSFMFGDFIFIYNNTSQTYYYYDSERNRFIIENREHPCPWNMQEVTPATKEQRDILMKAMNNAGYEWNIEKKKLKKK